MGYFVADGARRLKQALAALPEKEREEWERRLGLPPTADESEPPIVGSDWSWDQSWIDIDRRCYSSNRSDQRRRRTAT